VKRQITSDIIVVAVLFIISALLIIFTMNFPFYWDNIAQLSVPANWYLQTDFKSFFLPDSIATGHPTFAGMYFAILWKLFGRSLYICHIGMFPFVFGLLYQLYRLLWILNIRDRAKVFVIMGFVFIDATFLAQLSLITFDVIQLFLFFWALNLILIKRNSVFIFVYIALILTSLRAAMMAGGLLLFNLFFDYYCLKVRLKFRNYVKYLPGILSLGVFFYMFWEAKGWIINNTVSGEWKASGELATFYGMIRNTGIFIWRLIDFGRVGIFVFFLGFLIKSFTLGKFQDNRVKILFFVILAQLIVFFPILVASRNPFGHRYLLPIFVPVIILTVYWIFTHTKISSIWLASLAFVLFSGHFWVYPLKISEGWDATTMHWKYFKVSKEMNKYIGENKIEKSEISSFFPNRASRYLTHIEDDIKDVYSGEPFANKYILFSNTFNCDNYIIDSLYAKDSKWQLVKKFSDGGVFMSLYKRE
jgi:hypothetical protein